jgi:hypothetical protein
MDPRLFALAVPLLAAVAPAASKGSPWKEHLSGGLADGLLPQDFDRRSIARGRKVELEHTSDPELATEIAMDHLVEDPKYYEKLAKMQGHANRRKRPARGYAVRVEYRPKVRDHRWSLHNHDIDAMDWFTMYVHADSDQEAIAKAKAEIEERDLESGRGYVVDTWETGTRPGDPGYKAPAKPKKRRKS